MKKIRLTAVELCIIVAILAIIAAVVFVVVDPASRVAAERNAQRWTDVDMIMSGIQNAYAGTKGVLTDELKGIDQDSSTVQMIVNGSAAVQCGLSCATETVAASDCTVDGSALVQKGYIAALPTDPKAGADGSGYYVNYDEGVFTVGACNPEQEKGGVTPTIRISK